MKSLIEEMIFQLINGSEVENFIYTFIFNIIIIIIFNFTLKDEVLVKKSQCTLRVLETWYKDKSMKIPLVIVIPDFETFNPIILRDFILVLR